MDNFTQQFTKLADIESPKQLHSKIMSAVLVESAKKPFNVTISLITITLLTSGFFLVTKLLERDVPALGITLARNFDLRLDTLILYGAILLQQIPIGLFVVFLCTFLLGVYFITFVHRRYQSLGSWLNHHETNF